MGLSGVLRWSQESTDFLKTFLEIWRCVSACQKYNDVLARKWLFDVIITLHYVRHLFGYSRVHCETSSGLFTRLGNPDLRSPVHWHGLTLIPVRLSSYIHYKIWDEMIYLFPNFNGATVEVWDWINNFIHNLLGIWLFIHAGTKVHPC